MANYPKLKKIKGIAAEEGLSIREICKESGVNRMRMYDYINGDRKANLWYIAAIAEAMTKLSDRKVTVDDLLENVDVEKAVKMVKGKYKNNLK